MTSRRQLDPANLQRKTFALIGAFRTLLVMTDGVADDYFPADPGMAQLYADLVLNGILAPSGTDSATEPLTEDESASPRFDPTDGRIHCEADVPTAEGTVRVVLALRRAVRLRTGRAAGAAGGHVGMPAGGARDTPLAQRAADPAERLRLLARQLPGPGFLRRPHPGRSSSREAQLDMETATLRDGRTVLFDPEVIGDGAMKEVHFTHDRSAVVCFYLDSSAGTDPVRARRLEKIIGPNNPTVPRTQGGAARSDAEAAYYRALYCWPTAVITKPRFGILAPAYPVHFYFQHGPDFIKGNEKNGMRFIGPKNRGLLEKFAPEELGDFQKYLGMCIQMARGVSRLHNAGLAHSDLSPSNVLVDPTRGVSIIIDIDSLVVEGLFPPDVAGTKGYIAPEVLSTLELPPDRPEA